jgi:hypothetical protein
MSLSPLWSIIRVETGAQLISIGNVGYLLLGFPPDYREDEFVANAISPFGRVMYWVDDTTHLAKLIVRARVVDYESVPRFIVLTEGEGFQGESWTVQCEILQGNLLGGTTSR